MLSTLLAPLFRKLKDVELHKMRINAAKKGKAAFVEVLTAEMHRRAVAYRRAAMHVVR